MKLRDLLHSFAVLYRTDPEQEDILTDLSRDSQLNDVISQLLSVVDTIGWIGPRKPCRWFYYTVQTSYVALYLNLVGRQAFRWTFSDADVDWLLLDLSTALPDPIGGLFTWSFTIALCLATSLNYLLYNSKESCDDGDGKQWKLLTMLPNVCNPRKLEHVIGFYSDAAGVRFWRLITGMLLVSVCFGWII